MIDELLQRQNNLQAEAIEVAKELKLDDLLSPMGKPIRVGSAALGLMVWRDLDITVVCPKLNMDAVAQIGAKLMVHVGVQEVQFRNDSGTWKVDSHYPDGLYLGIKYRSGGGHDWKLDIWFIDEPERQPDLIHMKTIPNRLNPELRASILSIKDIWAKRPEYGKTVTSYDIYKSVLDDGVQTPEQFQEWLIHR
ncbi:hypothetical protein [Thermoflavimicrobium daqui]|jgi:hypothetical protein|uniref:Uncharacterized protein n=1 Tax=Thermoflavimicrobium daqui TaxID=2137476 RepID=A0A364K0W3_9BACL|nr:hypothetical protein [Thermoflavimicrobium daqui]RAL21324.1 hypothetical protein DL897_16940 [Thermoflavimicrobium daqui]